MDDIMHKYTAGEFLEWLTDMSINEYCVPQIVEIDEEAVPYDVLDIEKLKNDFIKTIRRYQTVKRGKILYIHDNKTCRDIFSWNFNEHNYEQVQNTANNLCELLNNHTMRFVAEKDKDCW